MAPLQRVFSAVLAFCTVSAIPPPALAVSQSEAPCVRAAGREGSAWIWSGAWSADGSRLVLVDVASGSLRVYGTGGDPAETVRRPGTGPLDFSRPNGIAAVEGGFWLKDGATHFVLLDERLEPIRGLDTQEVPPGVNGVPRAFFNWTATADRLYGLGDVLTSEDERGWERGWLEMAFAEPASPRLFRPAPSEEALHRLYRLGNRYAAADGQRVFILLLEGDDVGVLQIAPRIRRLRAFPKGFSALPRPPDSRAGRHTAEVYGFLEGATYPAGLHAWDGMLFVLTRRPAEDGTRWTLHALDPEEDRLVGSVSLPTNAAHVTLVPGPRHWALVDKATVEPLPGGRGGRHPVEGIVFLGADLLRDPSGWGDELCTPRPPGVPADDETENGGDGRP